MIIARFVFNCWNFVWWMSYTLVYIVVHVWFIFQYMLPIYSIINPFHPAAAFTVIAGLLFLGCVAFVCTVITTLSARKCIACARGKGAYISALIYNIY